MTEPLGCTPSQTVGPFLAIALPWADGPDVVSADHHGAIRIVGRLTDGAGQPVPDGLVEVWQADPDGRFDHPDDPRGAGGRPGFRGFGRCPTDQNGEFWFRTVKPGALPAGDGVVEAPHLDVSVFARGLLDRLVTRLYFPDEDGANAADPVLRTVPDADRLIARPAGDGTLRFDLCLQGTAETPFFAL
ncbi:MAG TPA: protocatechuate 3,4-dioxygenase subunit alpha [Jatrophihabitans sp.]|nr:protocatechuate 3,4-dioxygenase subunit alpha [Jatrophihabitans sp.]